MRPSVTRARHRALAWFCSLANPRASTACAFGLASLCVTAGCSAVTALAETRRAERALVSTQGLRDTPSAVYALTMGRAYLEKAREEAAEAHYGNAVAYARAARHAADDAQRTQVQHVNARFAPAPSSAARPEGPRLSAARPEGPRSRTPSSRETAAPVAPREGTR